MKRVTTALPKASKEELEAAFAASMMEYQAYNTALYDAIDPSILLNGAYETVDRLQRKEFANGDLRDGVGLYNYVRDLTRRDPIEQQIEAMRALATHGVLSADKNVTQVQFDRHVNGLLTKWTDVNLDAANVADFRNRLIASLPDEPLTSKVVLIRIYLVDACNANQEETKTVQGLVRLVTKRGRELGLPAGSVLDEVVAPVIEKDKRDKKDDGKTQNKKPGDTVSNLFSARFSDITDTVSGGSSANSLLGVVLTVEDLGRPGTGLVAHLSPDQTRRLRTALLDALREIGQTPGP